MTTMAEQAVSGLDVVAAHGIVRVRDGQDTWLCREPAYDAAMASLEAREADESDEGGAEAYGELCRTVRRDSPIATVIGSAKGEWETLVREAIAAGLVEADDARRMYGIES